MQKKTYPAKQQEEYNGSIGATQSFLTASQITLTTRKFAKINI